MQSTSRTARVECFLELSSHELYCQEVIKIIIDNHSYKMIFSFSFKIFNILLLNDVVTEPVSSLVPYMETSYNVGWMDG